MRLGRFLGDGLWRRAFDRPVFILSAPRSGSTLLFEILGQCAGTFHLPEEVDEVWWRLFPYDRCGPEGEPTDCVAPEELTVEKAHALRRWLYRHALKNAHRRWRRAAALGLRYPWPLRPIRYLDKTVSNCFHVGCLARAFDAPLYVLLARDPRAAISSMIEGWPELDRFGKHALTPWVRADPEATVPHWTYPAPPRWRAMLREPLPRICAWSWRKHVEGMHAAAKQAPGRVCWVSYEALRRDPAGTARAVARAVDLPWSEAAQSYAERSPFSATTVSAPKAEKWRQRHPEAIAGVLPEIAEWAHWLGYDLSDTDPDAGGGAEAPATEREGA
jgi:hypothetical protein